MRAESGSIGRIVYGPIKGVL